MPRPDGMHARRRASSIEAACVGNSGQEDVAWRVVYLGNIGRKTEGEVKFHGLTISGWNMKRIKRWKERIGTCT